MGKPSWPKIRRIWITVGGAAGVIFIVWSLLAYRARPEARTALESTSNVAVTRGDAYWSFVPQRAAGVGLVFFPGALVEPAAYAPIVRSVADRGYVALLVEMPRRGALGGADGPEVLTRARSAMSGIDAVRRWVVGGHSRGGVVAARMMHEGGPELAGLVLVGTSHPRDFSLARAIVPITRVFGTRDTIADVEKLEATRGNLPVSTRLVRIDGGNHSQFGHYGFQPGDWPATIDRAAQHRLTVDAIVTTLDAASAGVVRQEQKQ